MMVVEKKKKKKKKRERERKGSRKKIFCPKKVPGYVLYTHNVTELDGSKHTESNITINVYIERYLQSPICC